MRGSEVADQKAFDALHALLATARDLARTLGDDPQVERLVRAFRGLPERDRETILEVIEKDSAWRSIVERTAGPTGISVRPNPHASLYVHVLNQADLPALDLDASRRDADVIRRGVATLVQLLPLLFQEGVHQQWTAAARDIVRTSEAPLRELAVRLAREVELLVAEVGTDGADPRR